MVGPTVTRRIVCVTTVLLPGTSVTRAAIVYSPSPESVVEAVEA